MNLDYCPECDGPRAIVDIHDEEVLGTLGWSEFRVIDLECGHEIVLPATV